MRPRDVLARQEMPGIGSQRTVRPLDDLVVLALVPVGMGNLQQNARRHWIALEGLLPDGETAVQVAKGVEQAPVQKVRIGVIGIEVERALETPSCAGPVPIAQEQHGAERDLRVGARVVHRERPERGRPRGRVRVGRRREAQLGRGAMRERQAGVRRRVRRIQIDRRLKRLDRLRNLGARARQQMRAPAADQLVNGRRGRQHAERPACRQHFRGGRFSHDVSRETVPGARHRLDVAPHRARIGERFPEGRDVHREDAFLDVGPGPDELQEFILGDEVSRPADQRDQHIVRLRLERDVHTVRDETALRDVEHERSELVTLTAAHDGLGES